MFKELFVRSYYEFDFVYDWFLVPMRKILKEHICKLDEVLEGDDDTLTKLEEEQLNKMLKDYEQNPEILEFDLTHIKDQQKKFQLVSEEESFFKGQITTDKAGAGQISNKNEDANNKKNAKRNPKATTGKGKKKDDNCVVF